MRMTVAVCLISTICVVVYGDDRITDKIPDGLRHPVKAGTYVVGGCTYVCGIAKKGSQSERRCGSLFFQGFPVRGKYPGEVKDTPMGKFVYFGEIQDSRYDSGWLKTLTYDSPVFDKKGQLLPGIDKRLQEWRKQMQRDEKQREKIAEPSVQDDGAKRAAP